MMKLVLSKKINYIFHFTDFFKFYLYFYNQKITKKSGGKYTVGSSATTLYPAAGGSDDWAKGFAGIKYSYTIEMGDTGRYGFVLPASHIEPNGRDGYTFAETVARAITSGKKYSRKRAL